MKDYLNRLMAFIRRKPLLSAAVVIVLFITANLAMYQIEKFPTVACSP